MRTRCAILCIDDQELELSIRKMVLENAGYAVFTAANTVQGSEMFNAHRIDLVMTDHPEGVIGIAFVAELRKLNPRLPIMILSGGNIPSHRVNPPDYFLHKLEGPTKMIAMVRSAISGLGTH
jgi:two-component system, autoinducer 1 sensor kinase/phosphatase LuxN